MSVLRFRKDELIEALEARRPWAEKTDAERLREHQKAEQAHLVAFRAACSEAMKWDYQTVKEHQFSAHVSKSGRGGFKEHPPACPSSRVADLDRQLAIVRATRQERFIVGQDGVWSKVFHLLTHDDSLKAEMC